MNKIMKIMVLVLIAGLLITLTLSAKKKTKKIPKKGDKAPSIILFDLNNDYFKLKKQLRKDKDSIYVIDFWATYCKPCKTEIKELIKLRDELNNKNIKFYFISIDKSGDTDKVKKFLKDNKMNIPKKNILLDIYQMTLKKYGLKSVPGLFIIDQKGKVTGSFIGFKEEKKEANLKQIKKILTNLMPAKEK